MSAKMRSTLSTTPSSGRSNAGVADPVQPSTVVHSSPFCAARRNVTVTFGMTGNFVVSITAEIVTVDASFDEAVRRSCASGSRGSRPNT